MISYTNFTSSTNSRNSLIQISLFFFAAFTVFSNILCYLILLQVKALILDTKLSYSILT